MITTNSSQKVTSVFYDEDFLKLSRRLSLAAGLDPIVRENIHNRLVATSIEKFSLPEYPVRDFTGSSDEDIKCWRDLDEFGYHSLTPKDTIDFKTCTQLIDTLQPANGYGLTQRLIAHEEISKHNVFLNLILDPHVLKLAAQYFGIAPTIQCTFAWRNDFSTDPKSVDRGDYYWHFDLHGHVFLKYFVYLTDVDSSDGPHQYIPGTQFFHMGRLPLNTKPETLSAMQSKLFAAESNRNKSIQLLDRDISDLSANKCEFVGRRGTRFLENTRGLHRGTPINREGGSRYIFQMLVTPYESCNNDKCTKILIRRDLVNSLLVPWFSESEINKILSTAFIIER